MRYLVLLIFIFLITFSCKKGCVYGGAYKFKNESEMFVDLTIYSGAYSYNFEIANDSSVDIQVNNGNNLIELGDSAHMIFNHKWIVRCLKYYSGTDCGYSLHGIDVFCPNQYESARIDDCSVNNTFTMLPDFYLEAAVKNDTIP